MCLRRVQKTQVEISIRIRIRLASDVALLLDHIQGGMHFELQVQLVVNIGCGNVLGWVLETKIQANIQ